ncbi:hypothetical protein EIN_284160 [Entamoeba invadens IP1]|uniref:Phorbol-ester/DAG-type domain-containing protein n=1 Tax=Entamoeba invadens IP1 TaxID=370355 RepID=L7FJY7_ENTIV|nr:hypothetical protein EIN_284160 [Entamoeba invadens IP1]ELP84860.1 hypothetical protein EIN_284160 [Entamoeba invadens IP1]|eukprot:XP_004184206.1 hypothetical protein EIN_284160 [Entamoeba invadens IP1]
MSKGQSSEGEHFIDDSYSSEETSQQTKLATTNPAAEKPSKQTTKNDKSTDSKSASHSGSDSKSDSHSSSGSDKSKGTTSTGSTDDDYSDDDDSSENYPEMLLNMKKQLEEYKQAVDEDRQRDKQRICRLESDLEDERDSNESLKGKITECVGTIKQLIGELKKLKDEKEDLIKKIDEETQNHIMTIKELQTLKESMNPDQSVVCGTKELELMVRITMENGKIEKVDAVRNKDNDREDLLLQKSILEKKIMENNQNYTLQKEKIVHEKNEIENKLSAINSTVENLKSENDKMKEKVSLLETEKKQNTMIMTGNYQDQMMEGALRIVTKLSAEGHFKEIERLSVQDVKRYVSENCYFPRMFMKIEDDCVRMLNSAYRKWSNNNKSVLEGNEKIPLVTFIMHYTQADMFGDYLKKKNDKTLEYFMLLEEICNFTKQFSLDPNVKKMYGEHKVPKNISFISESKKDDNDDNNNDTKLQRPLSASVSSGVARRMSMCTPKESKVLVPQLSKPKVIETAVKRTSLQNKERRKKSDTLTGLFKSGSIGSSDSNTPQEGSSPVQDKLITEKSPTFLNQTIPVSPTFEKKLEKRKLRKTNRGSIEPLSLDDLATQIELHEKVEKSKNDTLKMPGEVKSIVQYQDKLFLSMNCYNDKNVGWVRCVEAANPTNIISTFSCEHEILKMRRFDKKLFVGTKDGKVMIFDVDKFTQIPFEDALHPGIVDFFCYKEVVYLVLISSEFVRYTFKDNKIIVKVLKHKGVPVAAKQILVKDDLLYIATNSGISKFDLKSKVVLKKEEQIQLKTTQMLVIDNNLWTYYPDVSKLNVYNEKLQLLHEFSFDEVVFIVECGTNVWVGETNGKLTVVDENNYDVIQSFDLSNGKGVRLITGSLTRVGKDEKTAKFLFLASTDDLNLHKLETSYKAHEFIPSIEEGAKCPICKKTVKQKDSIQCIKCKLVMHKMCDPYNTAEMYVCNGKGPNTPRMLQLKDKKDTDKILTVPPVRKPLGRINRAQTMKLGKGVTFPDEWKNPPKDAGK